MPTFILSVLLAGAASLQAPPAAIPVNPGPDSAEVRRSLRELSMCLAEARPRWARRTLGYAYLSEEQASDAAQALIGRDGCAMEHDSEYVFRTSGLVGGLAEYFLRAEIGRADFRRVAAALSTATARNSSEDFALCVAARDPAAARDLAMSDPGSGEESGAAGRLAQHLPACVAAGEQLTVDLPSLRALAATALYRGVHTTLASRN